MKKFFLHKLFPLSIKWLHRVFYTHRWDKFDSILKQRMHNTPEFYFIEIGANDGQNHDRLHQYIRQYHWKGVLVEPVKHYFDKLVESYINVPGLHFENFAISSNRETKTFYRLKSGLDFLPEWYEGLGSFNLDIILKHRWAIPNIEEYIIQEAVQCIPFQDLLTKNNVTKIDLLLVDTEGYDAEIIKQIWFDTVKPYIILYEHKHLSHQDQVNTTKLLRSQGYTLASRFGNTLAFLDY